MNNPNLNLPLAPSYDESCELIDNYPDDYWEPALSAIQTAHGLVKSDWQRIKEGANVLFRHHSNLIIKIVPPNWKYQGTAEIESAKLLANKLSLPIPDVIASGEINNWVYVVMTLLPGTSMADLWEELSIEEKMPVVKQLGGFINQLHLLSVDSQSPLKKDWKIYHKELLDDCLPRHQRKKAPACLTEQMSDYLASVTSQHNDYFDDNASFFIHMDLHPWNLLLEKVEGIYQISGVIDFGDAVIGRSRLLELATPLIFVCQGNKKLIDTMITSYQLLDNAQALNKDLQQKLMAITLLRPASDFNFVLKQVPISGPRDTLEEIASQLFPI